MKRKNNRYVLCRCDCGNECEVILYDLLREGKTTKCRNCAHHKHDMCDTREYNTWRSMKERCTNPENIGYKYYGGKGIKICERWMDSFENFYKDMGDRPKEMTLDRVNGNGDYAPENCRWATWTEQNQNKSYS